MGGGISWGGRRPRRRDDNGPRFRICQPGGGFEQINLVSDVPGVAALTDPDLVNAWGLSASPGTDAAPGSPLWVSDNGTDKTTLYAGASATTVSKSGLVVDITSGAPTGQVFNTRSDRVRRP